MELNPTIAILFIVHILAHNNDAFNTHSVTPMLLLANHRKMVSKLYDTIYVIFVSLSEYLTNC